MRSTYIVFAVKSLVECKRISIEVGFKVKILAHKTNVAIYYLGPFGKLI